MLRLYSITLGLSAMLMFAVQPIISKIILPVLGGNPSVWNAVVMFFELMLLLGYGYVYLGRELLGTHKQALVHAGLLVISLLFIPLSLSSRLLEAPAYLEPVSWLVGILLATVGVPFFTISATAPLLSSWLAESKHPAAKNPYMLYAASNIGSMFGLLSYPFIVEPFFSLTQQRILWSVGYGLLMVMIGFSLKHYLKTRNQKQKKEAIGATKPIQNLQRALWVLLAFVPSSLMLSVTSHITNDIAPIPLLLVVPLALYLLSFVFVFAAKPIGIEWSRTAFVPFVFPLVLLLGLSQSLLPYWPWTIGLFVYFIASVSLNPNLHTQSLKTIGRSLLGPVVFFVPFVLFFSGKIHYLLLCLWYVMGFFLVAMICHGRLSELKPRPEKLTEYYFFLSLGGALGGIFNVLIAPHLFTGFYELHLLLGVAFFLLSFHKADWRNLWPIACGVVAALLSLLLYYLEYKDLGMLDRVVVHPFNDWMWSKRYEWGNIGFANKPDMFAFFELVIPALVAFYLRKTAPALGVMASILLLIGVFSPGSFENVKFQDRNFLGILEARFVKQEPVMYLTNGTTQHGFQYKDKERATMPTSYYSWGGPLGVMVQTLRAREGGAGNEIAAVGLGAGTVACLAQEYQHTTFFEINPLVDKIAHDPALFSYLRDCPGTNTVVMGDARISMKAQPDHFFSLIILDAFNSDSIPIHLLTKEALALYMDKLTDHGIIAYHISNRHLNLLPVVGNLAATQKLYGVSAFFEDSNWVFVARSAEDFGTLTEDQRFNLLVPDDTKRLWTDDYSDIISILKIW